MKRLALLYINGLWIGRWRVFVLPSNSHGEWFWARDSAGFRCWSLGCWLFIVRYNSAEIAQAIKYL